MYRKGGGGLIVYFSTNIPSKKLKLPKTYTTIEAIAVESSIGRREIIFIAIYRPPKQSGKSTEPKYLQRVEDEMNAICQWTCMKKQLVVILGDLNMDRLVPDRGEGRILKDLEEVNNLHCLITEPTRVTANSQTLLDVLLTNTPELFKRCGVFNPDLSDHHMIYGEMTEKVRKHRPKTIMFRQTKNTNFELLNQELLNAPWHVGDIFSGVDDKYDYWKGLLESVVNLHAPLKSKRVREKDIPYMTQEWKKALREKRKYAIKFAKDRTAENFELKRKYRNIATRERRRAIREYWHTKSKEFNTKPQEFYNIFKPFISDKTKISTTICLKDDGNNVVKDQKEVAEMLATYFTNAALNIGGDNVINLTEEDHNNHTSVMMIRENHGGNPFEFKSLSEVDVKYVLEKINPKKSCGWDPRAPPKLLKNVANGIVPSLTSLYNDCMRQSKWPSEWKKGEWTPVFKKGERYEDKNYRPITSLITIDKIFEHLLCNQVTRHYDSTLYNRMTAYRKRHSCQTTLLRLVEDWKQAVDNNQLISILSTDMSKAFDSLSHSLIIKKLEAYGFSNCSISLMRSFFDNRQNRVKLNDITSEWKKMERGCPQGSSFGPLLWNLFQNDLSLYVKDANLTMYADDHQLYVMGNNYETVGNRLKAQGLLASTWYKNNFLLANTDKFQFLTVNPRKLDMEKRDVSLNIEGEDIGKSDKIKLLGVHIDENLNFTSHISDICTKASQKVGVLMRLRKLIPCSAKSVLYKSFILPHLTYCHLVWHFCKSTDSKKLERIQERALRAVYGSSSETYEELLERAKLPTLYNRRLQDMMIFMYKIKYGLAPGNVSDLFRIKDNRYLLRNSDFEIPCFNTVRHGKHSVRYLGPFLWSKLNSKMRDLPTLNSFRNNIRKQDLTGFIS